MCEIRDHIKYIAAISQSGGSSPLASKKRQPSYAPYILRVLSIDVDAMKAASDVKRTPVARAVWSLKTLRSVHCLHRYTLKHTVIVIIDKILLKL